MNKLIKIEMERAFKNKMLIISVVIGLVIVGFNIWNEIIPARKTLDKLLEMGKPIILAGERCAQISVFRKMEKAIIVTLKAL